MKRLKAIGVYLTKPELFFYSLIWMMVILVVGTIAQKYVGLYQAQRTYFFSFIIWLGPVPLPGGYTTMGIIYINLLTKLIFGSPWHWSRVGTLILHLGATLLLTGGLLTTLFSKEGNMVIYEGASSDYFSDYHDRELIVEDGTTGDRIAGYPWKELQPGKVFSVPNLPLKIEILKVCRNCEVFPRKTSADDPVFKELRGRAKDFDIKPIALDKEDEKNQSGVVFRMSGVNEDKNGIHFSVDFVNVSPSVDIDGTTYSIALRRSRTYVPFKIKLINFEKQFYPGTEIPRSYQSEIVLRDGKTEWPGIVRMNEPLRYKGYTVYQSSFIDNGDTEATIFAVVKNAGRLFPYISSIVMCFGLLIHLFINLPKLIRKA